METPPFASLAQLNILVLPIGRIRRASFAHWAALIRSFHTLRLADIPPDPRDDRARFLPSALASGSLHLAFPARPPPTSLAPYALFRPAAFVHGVIGVADCSTASSLAAILAEFYAALHDLFGPNPVFPLAGRCYAFDPADATSDLDVGGALDGLTVIPAVVGDKRIYLGTLLANFCGAIIGEFAGLVRVLDTPPRIDELNRFLLPTLSHTLDGDDTPLSPVFASSSYAPPPSLKLNGSAPSPADPDAVRSPTLSRSETLPVLPSAYMHTNGSASRLSSLNGLGIGPAPSSRSPSPLPQLQQQPKRSSTASPNLSSLRSGGGGFQGFKSRSATLALTPPPKKKPATGGIFGAPTARLAKLTADLYLLSGRLGDAQQWYADAAAGFRGGGVGGGGGGAGADTIWQAAALEGAAVASMLDAWNKQDQPAAVLPTSGHDPPAEQWVELLEKLTQAVSLYWKATPSAPEESALARFELTAITTLYCDAVVRLTKFLSAVWAAGGWGPGAFACMLANAHGSGNASGSWLPAAFARAPQSEGTMHRLTALTSISRTQIANVAAQAHGPFLLHLLPVDRARVLQFLASTYAALGFWRKEAYVLRELEAVLVELLVSAREEASASASAGASAASGGGFDSARYAYGFGGATPTAGEFGDVGGAGRLRLNMNGGGGGGGGGGLAVRENERVDGNESLVRLAMRVCGAYGVRVDETVRVWDAREGEAGADEVSAREVRVRGLGAGGSGAGAGGNWEVFGWPELQVGVVREAVSLVEFLPDHPTVAQLALTAIRALGRFLAPSEQHHLYVVASRALATARRRGDTRRLRYWSDCPLGALELVPLPGARVVTGHAVGDLLLGGEGEGPLARTGLGLGLGKDPFLYNPRVQAAVVGKVIAVQHETLEVLVTLRNPHAFDFEFQSVVLSTSGVPFRTQPMSISIPANSYQVLRMSGVPASPGTLAIRGCTVQVTGCLPRTFLFPLPTKEDDARREKQLLALELDYEMIKDVGLDARPGARGGRRRSALGTLGVERTEDQAGAMRFLECTVLPEQPLMRVKRTSLTRGAVVLYDGETSTLTLTLENMSPLSVNFLRVTFEDSTLAPAQAALAEGELSTAAAHETEYELVRRPVFTWDPPSQPIDVPTGKTATVAVACLGKVGCTGGAVLLSYGAVAVAQGGEADTPDARFYTRQILYPVVVTVHQNLACQSMDVIRFGSNERPLDGGRLPLDVLEEGDWCLFTVDVRNLFGTSFEVTLERTQDDVPPGRVTEVVSPGTTLRLAIPLRREYISPDALSQPIPSLLQRQFLVSKDRLSTLEEREQRMLFWYREKLLSCLNATWREPVSGRTGELSLRKQRLTLPMLDAFRADRVRVELSVEAEVDGEVRVVEERARRYAVPANEFVYVKAKVTNVHWHAAYMSLSINAIPPTPTAFVLHEGSPTDVPLGEVGPGQSAERELCMIFVAEGNFDWAATVRIHGEESDAGRRELSLVAVPAPELNTN